MDLVGPRPVINLARKMGITSYLPAVPSIALGTPDISLFEMVGAYSSFANQGIYVKPIMITRIEDKNGRSLYDVQPVTRDVLSEEAAYVTVNLMQGVTQSGSGARLRHAGLEKTNYIYMKKLLQDILLFLKTLLPVKQEQLKIKVMDGSWGWFPTLQQVYGLAEKIVQYTLKK